MKNVVRLDEVETRTFPHGSVQIARLPSQTITRVRFEPGFRWSNDLQPIAGTKACMVHHVGYAIAGTLRIRTSTGEEFDVHAGEAHDIPSGHDGWVVSDEPYIAIDVSDDMATFGQARV